MLGHTMTGKILRLTAVAAFAAGLSACSIIPDWADPTTWFGDDKPTAADTSADTPDLANTPDKPGGGTSAADQKTIEDSLAADRAHAQYSGEALRGNAERPAAPPPDAPATTSAVSTKALSDATAASKPADDAAQPAAQAQAAPAQVDKSVTTEPAGTALPGTLPSVGTPEHPAAKPTASADPRLPPGAEAAVPPVAAVEAKPVKRTVASAPASGFRYIAATTIAPPDEQRGAAADPSGAAMGFKPSAAPPLDPSVADFVPAAIMQNYRSSASQAGAAIAQANRGDAAVKPVRAKRHEAAIGGPEAMSGNVVANLGAITAGTSTKPSVYVNSMGLSASLVVYFHGDTAALNGDALSEVQDAAQKFRSQGGQGFVRVVGHSSSRTADMPVERHLELIYRKSQDRANVVAQALIRAGVPANKILVEAVGDSQPIYYESMPKGEDGNRRTEIFFQS
jgi:outer membrane protein OmpA-like peptidoglycan-associated protein